MKYIAAGCKDESIHYYEIENDFIMIVCKNIRYNDIKTSKDYETKTSDLNLSKGDTIHVKYFNDRGNIVYTYIIGYIHNNIYIPINNETLVSRGFIKENNKVFIDITKQIERDNKIDKIIRNHE